MGGSTVKKVAGALRYLATVMLAFLYFTPVVANSAVALMLNTDSKLTGANNIVIAGELFDVRFADGRCLVVFKDCNGFVFGSEDAGRQASKALLNQVLINNPLGQFDSNPSLTYGCFGIIECVIYSPYDDGGPIANRYLPMAINSFFEGNDMVNSFLQGNVLGVDSVATEYTLKHYKVDDVWAVWTKQCVTTYSANNPDGVICVPSPRNFFTLPDGQSEPVIMLDRIAYEPRSNVPEPSTIFLLALSWLGLVCMRRKRPA